MQRGVPMGEEVYGPFDTVRGALVKWDELTNAGKKPHLTNILVKGTAKYHKRGWLKKATFQWFVKVSLKQKEE